jgi:hypothetical protein
LPIHIGAVCTVTAQKYSSMPSCTRENDDVRPASCAFKLSTLSAAHSNSPTSCHILQSLSLTAPYTVGVGTSERSGPCASDPLRVRGNENKLCAALLSLQVRYSEQVSRLFGGAGSSCIGVHSSVRGIGSRGQDDVQEIRRAWSVCGPWHTAARGSRERTTTYWCDPSASASGQFPTAYQTASIELHTRRKRPGCHSALPSVILPLSLRALSLRFAV